MGNKGSHEEHGCETKDILVKLHYGGEVVNGVYTGGDLRLLPISRSAKVEDLLEQLHEEYGSYVFKYELDGDLMTVSKQQDLDMAIVAHDQLSNEGCRFLRGYLVAPTVPISPALTAQGTPSSCTSFPTIAQTNTTHEQSHETNDKLIMAVTAAVEAVMRESESSDTAGSAANAAAIAAAAAFAATECWDEEKAADAASVAAAVAAAVGSKPHVGLEPLPPGGESLATSSFGSLTSRDASRVGSAAGSDHPESDNSLETKTSLAPLPISSWEIDYDELTLGEKLGQGSFGSVYQGEWQGTTVAVKVFSQSSPDAKGVASELCNEISILGRLRHPNVVLFMGACTRPPNPSAVVFEYCPNGDLGHLLRSKRKEADLANDPTGAVVFPWAARVSIALQVALGMTYLHRHTPPILHLDLKCANILMCESGEGYVAKVTDFGLSKHKERTYMSGGKGLCGTMAYMAPEVMKNAQFDERADVFSFGGVLMALTTLREPYHDLVEIQILYSILHGNEPDIGPDTPPKFSDLAIACRATSRDDRPSFDEIRHLLPTILQHDSASAPPMSPAVGDSPDPCSSTGTGTSASASQSSSVVRGSPLPMMGSRSSLASIKDDSPVDSTPSPSVLSPVMPSPEAPSPAPPSPSPAAEMAPPAEPSPVPPSPSPAAVMAPVPSSVDPSPAKQVPAQDELVTSPAGADPAETG